MNRAHRLRGGIPEIVRNDAGLYPGDLVSYFQAVFLKAQNCTCPYHNFRHMMHVLWLCHDACQFYGERLNPSQRRSLLVATLFHDFNHPGMMGDDDLNIERSVRAFRRCVAETDKAEEENIVTIIRHTEYPYRVASDQLPLCSQIIRDADLSQALSVAWIQQVIFGLAAEWRTQPIEILRAQANFLGQLHFTTDWAKQLFPPEQVQAKIEESSQLLKLLEQGSAT